MGSCLANQLQDWFYEDEDRVTAGLEPLYLIGRYGGSEDNFNQVQNSNHSHGIHQCGD